MPKLSELKARKTLMSVGLDASKFELACSVTNEVWLTETHAVRFNKRGDGRLRREAFLSRHLPPRSAIRRSSHTAAKSALTI